MLLLVVEEMEHHLDHLQGLLELIALYLPEHHTQSQQKVVELAVGRLQDQMVVLVEEHKHLPDLIKLDIHPHNQLQIQVLHLRSIPTDLQVETEVHFHQTRVLVVVVAQVVPDKQELQQLEVMVDLVFNYRQHSKIQYHNQGQMVVV
jgi:hypothetical protein